MSCCCSDKKQSQRFATGGLVPWDEIYAAFSVDSGDHDRPETCMRGNTLDCWFYGCVPIRTIKHALFQYDKGIVLNIRGLNPDLVTGIEFARGDVDPAVTMSVELTKIDPLDEEGGG